MPVRRWLWMLGLGVMLGARAATLLSVNVQGEPGNGFSTAPSVSGDGRLVVFQSAASNLVPDDTNAKTDIFLADRAEGALMRISLGIDGVEADGHSTEPVISADGRVIVFTSAASNLVPDDTNGVADIFRYDRRDGLLTRVSLGGRTRQANGAAAAPAVSADGRFVAFRSTAENLVPNDGNGFADIFLRDTREETTVRISVNSAGEEADAPSYGTPSLSADGRYVAFVSAAANLSPLDGNGVTKDIFVRDTQARSTVCVSHARGTKSAAGESASPSLSADGRTLAFIAFAEGLVPGDGNHTADVFLADLATGEITRVAGGNDAALAVSVSADGRRLVFLSHAANLLPGDHNEEPDIFRYDRDTRQLTRVNVTPDGTEADDNSSAPAISADGSVIAFVSWSSALMPKQRFSRGDVFVTDHQP